ncbi:hypothetical protein [Chryseobacterium proteolyticum]|uniref:hypothetical protein n=1 Tax=Chryseobacterium proteolyticum TaxID=118127 RepID=UPI003983712F
MQKFWYHSPVRFYKTEEELSDMTNPQNTQFFGYKGSYPLELSVMHRFLIPNYQNEVSAEELELWLVGDEETLIACQFGIANGKLFRVTFICDEEIEGSFQIRTGAGEILYYSNCVRFMDSTDDDGRKYIRVATKHYYNRNLFAFANSQYDWVLTNLPAYCLGQFDIDSEYAVQRTGKQNTLKSTDSYIDEVISYQFLARGDANILSFINAHVGNQSFFIDGTKRVMKDKPDVDEFAAVGKLKFVNVKDENGLNVLIDENEILDDSWIHVLSDNTKSTIYTYDTNNIIPTR